MRTKTTFKKGHAPSYTTTGKAHHQYRHGQFGTPLYKKWEAMKRRCLNKNEKCYKSYGGRGIKVCDKWLSFVGFAEDMASTFEPGLSLERVDVNGNYEPSNCEWIPLADQAKNKRSTNTKLVLLRLLGNVRDHPKQAAVFIRQELQHL